MILTDPKLWLSLVLQRRLSSLAWSMTWLGRRTRQFRTCALNVASCRAMLLSATMFSRALQSSGFVASIVCVRFVVCCISARVCSIILLR